MNDIDVLLFDLGGVLVELTAFDCFRKWAGSQTDPQVMWHAWMQSPSVRAYETGRLSQDDFADNVIEELKLSVSPAQFLADYLTWPKQLYPSVEQLLVSLRPTHTLACLSNCSDPHWRRVMEELGLEPLLDQHFGSHLLGQVKPDAACFERVVASLNTTPERILFFDDTLINVEAAAAMGMSAAHVRGVDELRLCLQEMNIVQP